MDIWFKVLEIHWSKCVRTLCEVKTSSSYRWPLLAYVCVCVLIKLTKKSTFILFPSDFQMTGYLRLTLSSGSDFTRLFFVVVLPLKR